MADDLKFSGDYTLDTLEIIGQYSTIDIKNLFAEFSLYEDLFSTGITCEILLSDAVNLPMYVPIIGEEKLRIVLKTPSLKSSISLTFNIVVLANRQYIKDRQQIYVIRGISEGSFNSLKNTISKSYKGLTHSQMAADIFKQYVVPGKSITDIDETRYTEDIVIPSMKPIEAIRWLAARSVSKLDGASDYFFYETLKNGYKFKSVSKLMSDFLDGPLEIPDFNLSPSGLTKDVIDLSKVDGFNYESNINMKQNIERGMIASTLISYNLESKEILNTEFKYVSDFGGRTHIGGVPFVYNRDETGIIDNPKSRVLMEQMGDQTKSDKRIQKRISLLQSLNTNRLKIAAPGNVLFEVGELAFVFIHSTEEVGSGAIPRYDAHLSGASLITAIRHKFNRTAHTLFLDVAKESMGHPPLVGRLATPVKEEDSNSSNTFFE